MVAQLFEATSCKVAGSNPVGVKGVFLHLSGSIMAVTYQGYLLGVKAVGVYS